MACEVRRFAPESWSGSRLATVAAEMLDVDAVTIWGLAALVRKPGRVHPLHGDVESAASFPVLRLWIAGAGACPGNGLTVVPELTAVGRYDGPVDDASRREVGTAPGEALLFPAGMVHGSWNRTRTIRHAVGAWITPADEVLHRAATSTPPIRWGTTTWSVCQPSALDVYQ